MSCKLKKGKAEEFLCKSKTAKERAEYLLNNQEKAVDELANEKIKSQTLALKEKEKSLYLEIDMETDKAIKEIIKKEKKSLDKAKEKEKIILKKAREKEKEILKKADQNLKKSELKLKFSDIFRFFKRGIVFLPLVFTAFFSYAIYSAHGWDFILFYLKKGLLKAVIAFLIFLFAWVVYDVEIRDKK